MSREAENKFINTPEYMGGVISLRGKIIPVIDQAMRLKLATAKNGDKRVLIV
jgi:chemotaxis signal transduction protein